MGEIKERFSSSTKGRLSNRLHMRLKAIVTIAAVIVCEKFQLVLVDVKDAFLPQSQIILPIFLRKVMDKSVLQE